MTSRPARLPPRGHDPHPTGTGTGDTGTNTGTGAAADARTAPRASRTARVARTRARILEAARRELGRNPDCTLADIAEAAGVARRTVYGHFAGRAALVEGLTADAAEAVRLASEAAARVPTPDAATDLARLVLTLWPTADRYRVLVNLAHQDLDARRADELLAPVRSTVAGILVRGRRRGVFHTTLPPGPLTRALEAYLLSLLDTANSGGWAADGTTAATTALIVAGVHSDLAATTVDRLHRRSPPHAPAPAA
ncbi:TetR/AcrR family transcriptional regulator [Streptomyces fuscichromogenes]|uniref:TetR/AcrR family transcriptional regulator n=1 Tax=Streptomyces fuscichromogenes TaxID=1324013 RepID=UPI003822CF4E